MAMTLLENTLMAIGRLQGKRECRREEEQTVTTDMIVNDGRTEHHYQLRWNTGCTVDVCAVSPAFQTRYLHLGRIEIFPFVTSPIAQAIAICGLIEADMQLRREE